MAARRAVGDGTPSTKASIRAIGVVLEQLQSQMTTVLEAVTGSTRSLRADMAGLEARLGERIAVLEQVVRQNSADIATLKQDVAALKQDVAGLKNDVADLKKEVADLRHEVARLRHDFDHREERGRMDALELRVASLEARLGVG
jgi:chromosome segregation ATPase